MLGWIARTLRGIGVALGENRSRPFLVPLMLGARDLAFPKAESVELVRLQAPLNRGCGESGFGAIDPGDARFGTRPAADEKASQWEDSYDD